MFRLGQTVVYGIHGICNIVDIETRVIDRKKVEYYVLEPQDQPGTRYYVPIHNQAAVAKLRPVMTPQELSELLTSKAAQQDIWITDENRRKQRYRELITSGDRAALLSMIGCLYKHKAEQAAAGRKFHLCDENFLRDAEKLLSAEFSLILGIPTEQVGDYITKTLGVQKAL